MSKRIPLERFPELRRLVRWDDDHGFCYRGKLVPKAKMLGGRHKAIIEYKGVKLVLKEDGTHGNGRHEHHDWQKWREIQAQDRKFFLPIVCHGEGWVAQEFAATITPVWLKHEKKHASVIGRLIETYKLGDVILHQRMGTALQRNWGLIEGRPMIFDFGFVE